MHPDRLTAVAEASTFPSAEALVQNLSSSPIDKGDGNLMSLRYGLFFWIPLKLANSFKNYGAGSGERQTNSQIIVS